MGASWRGDGGDGLKGWVCGYFSFSKFCAAKASCCWLILTLWCGFPRSSSHLSTHRLRAPPPAPPPSAARPASWRCWRGCRACSRCMQQGMASTPLRGCRPRCATSACRCEPQQQLGAEARLAGSVEQQGAWLRATGSLASSCMLSVHEQCSSCCLTHAAAASASLMRHHLLSTKTDHSNPPSATRPPAVGGHLNHQLPDDCVCGARGLPAGLADALLAAPAVPGGRLPRPLHPHLHIGTKSLSGAAAAAWGPLGRRG